MTIWLDDVRPMPKEYTHWCKTPQQAIYLLYKGPVEHISFDHDLGLEEPQNGTMVAEFIEGRAYEGEMPRLTWEIHSANPVGRQNIEAAMLSAERFWAIMESGARIASPETLRFNE